MTMFFARGGDSQLGHTWNVNQAIYVAGRFAVQLLSLLSFFLHFSILRYDRIDDKMICIVCVCDVRSLMLNTIYRMIIMEHLFCFSKVSKVLLHASGVFKCGEAFISEGWRARRELLHHWALGLAAAVDFWIYCQFAAQRLCRL